MNIRVEKACGIDMHQAFLMATMLDLAGTKDTSVKSNFKSRIKSG